MRPLLSGISVGRNDGLPPALVHEVCGAYLAHLDLEESDLLPVAREHLDATTLLEIGREFAARRGQSFDGIRAGAAAR
jgi:hypothetical protein